ncbi:MAG: hypothetical protein EOO29_32395, partial [Comamonadaceae bacterium]
MHTAKRLCTVRGGERLSVGLHKYDSSLRAQASCVSTRKSIEGARGMVFWCIFWGAVLGWFFPGHRYDDLAPFVGGILGLFAGLSLRWAVRSAIRSELQAHAAKLVAKPALATPMAPIAENRAPAAAAVTPAPVAAMPAVTPAASGKPLETGDD